MDRHRQAELGIQQRAGCQPIEFLLAGMDGLGLLHSGILQGPREFEGERLAVERVVADGGGTGLQQPGEQGMVHHRRLVQGQGQIGVVVFDGPIRPRADFVLGLAGFSEGDHIGWVGAGRFRVTAGLPGKGTREISE
jgi:hypothetical protein